MEHEGIPRQIGAGQLPMTEAEMIAALEATGHTVTPPDPPDPLAADREFLAGLEKATACTIAYEDGWRGGTMDEFVVKAMAYLRDNKGRL
tara:strand:- start:663 stop:932 length:270 start_codon:yes stop_codon:yes gene_type:complete